MSPENNGPSPGSGEKPSRPHPATTRSATRTPQAYVKPTNTDAGDQFGWAVALSADGNTLAVGARHEDSNGISQANNTTSNSGAAYVFARNGTAWAQQAYLKAIGPNVDDDGSSLSISDDGNTLIVGAPLADTSNPMASANFGYSVAVSHDASTIAAGAIDERSNARGFNGNQADRSATSAGAGYVLAGPQHAPQAYAKAPNADAGDTFGFSIALSGDGNVLIAGATDEAGGGSGVDADQASNALPTAGAAYIGVRTGQQWSWAHYLKATAPGANDSFGWAVAVSGDARVFAVTAPAEDGPGDTATDAGAAYVYY